MSVALARLVPDARTLNSTVSVVATVKPLLPVSVALNVRVSSTFAPVGPTPSLVHATVEGALTNVTVLLGDDSLSSKLVLPRLKRAWKTTPPRCALAKPACTSSDAAPATTDVSVPRSVQSPPEPGLQ